MWTSGRPRRASAARRAQAARAEGRVVQRLLHAFAALQSHRGCQPSALGCALAAVLASAAPCGTSAALGGVPSAAFGGCSAAPLLADAAPSAAAPLVAGPAAVVAAAPLAATSGSWSPPEAPAAAAVQAALEEQRKAAELVAPVRTAPSCSSRRVAEAQIEKPMRPSCSGDAPAAAGGAALSAVALLAAQEGQRKATVQSRGPATDAVAQVPFGTLDDVGLDLARSRQWRAHGGLFDRVCLDGLAQGSIFSNFGDGPEGTAGGSDRSGRPMRIAGARDTLCLRAAAPRRRLVTGAARPPRATQDLAPLCLAVPAADGGLHPQERQLLRRRVRHELALRFPAQAPPAVVAAGTQPVLVPVARSLPSSAECQAAVEAHLAGLDSLHCLSLTSVRCAVELRLGLPAGGLLAMKEEIKHHCSAFARSRMTP
jgi:hypothetical protein